MGTVATTEVDGQQFMGVNSRGPGYTQGDFEAAQQTRDRLIETYPDVMASQNPGQIPNDALFHAEATAILRAARANGGSLAGRTFDLHVDNTMCDSCDAVLPLLTRELGIPTIQLIGPGGRTRTIRNGYWAN